MDMRGLFIDFCLNFLNLIRLQLHIVRFTIFETPHPVTFS